MWLTFLTTLLNIIDLVLPLLIAVALYAILEGFNKTNANNKKYVQRLGRSTPVAQ